MLARIFDALFPAPCAGCQKEGAGILCFACTPAAVHTVPRAIPGIIRVFTSAGYVSGPGNALRVAKYLPNRPLLVQLASAWAAALAHPLRGGPVSLIVPVPSSSDRVWKRGFSPAAVLADALAPELRLPLMHALVVRPGPRQAHLRHAHRRAVGPRIRSVRNLDGACVLLVDDIVTTGATARACATELLGAGAAKVWLATLCAARA